MCQPWTPDTTSWSPSVRELFKAVAKGGRINVTVRPGPPSPTGRKGASWRSEQAVR